jgi:sensor histidine kinase YesM
MLIWSSVLLLLGIAAFLDSLFTFGEIFRTVNSILFMLVSLGLLVRTSAKMRQASREGLLDRMKQLEDQIQELSQKKKRVEVS